MRNDHLLKAKRKSVCERTFYIMLIYAYMIIKKMSNVAVFIVNMHDNNE